MDEAQLATQPDPEMMARVNALMSLPSATETKFGIVRVGPKTLSAYLVGLRMLKKDGPAYREERISKKLVARHYVPHQVFSWLKANGVEWSPTRSRPQRPNTELEIAVATNHELKEEILSLRKERNRLKDENAEHWGALSTLTYGRDHQGLLNQGEILMSQISPKRWTGIYFLIKGNRVVYVGQSINIWARVAQHKDKFFDGFAFEPCELADLDRLERLYIDKYDPLLNKAKPGPLLEPSIQRFRRVQARILDETVV